jgi:hypothetical protein
MFGMAIDAAALRSVEGAGNPDLKRAHALRLSASQRQPIGPSVIMRILVAGGASIVGNRNKGFDMAGLAIPREAVMRAAQGSARPALIRIKTRGTFFDAARLLKGKDWRDEKGRECQQREAPGRKAPPGHQSGE